MFQGTNVLATFTQRVVPGSDLEMNRRTFMSKTYTANCRL